MSQEGREKAIKNIWLKEFVDYTIVVKVRDMTQKSEIFYGSGHSTAIKLLLPRSLVLRVQY